MTARRSQSEVPEPRRQTLVPAAQIQLLLPLAILLFAIGMGMMMGAAGVILALSGGALVGVIALFWSSIRTLFGETPLSGADAYALGAPRAEEERKQAVLRALKDLEFERSVGKISDEDYKVLVSKYRAEAKQLLRMLDEASEPQRARVEALVQKRLVREGLVSKADAEAKVKAAKASKPEPAAGEEKEGGVTGTLICSQCGAHNDADAVFCKKCGARQKAEAPGGDAEPASSKEAV